MVERIRVMVETGKKKRVVASAFDWPGWDRSTKLGGDPVAVLERYRPRFAKVAALAGYGEAFARLGALEVVEEVEGIGMTDYYGVSGRTATAELEPLTEFILPGGGAVGAHLHHARTVCRRAERRVVSMEDPDAVEGSLRYLNRLSDLLFVAARWAAKARNEPEPKWQNPNKKR